MSDVIEDAVAFARRALFRHSIIRYVKHPYDLCESL